MPSVSSTPPPTRVELTGLREAIRRLLQTEKLIELIGAPGQNTPIQVSSLAGSSPAFLLAAIRQSTDQLILACTEESEQAVELHDDLAFLLGSDAVSLFPSRQIVPYDFKPPVGEIVGRRLATLSTLQAGRQPIVVAPWRALLEPTIPFDQLQKTSITLRIGDVEDIDTVTDRLTALGLTRVQLVEEIGQFARRGGVIDLFSPGFDYPVRIEFFDIQIESIRQFDVATQRTIGTLQSVSLLPRREVLMTPEELERALARIDERDADVIRSRYLNDPELPGLEWLAPLFHQPRGSLLDFLPDAHLVWLPEQSLLDRESEQLYAEADALRQRLSERLHFLPRVDQYYHDREMLGERLARQRTIVLSATKRPDGIDFDLQPHPAFNSRVDLAGSFLRDLQQSGACYAFFSETGGHLDRLQQLFEEKGGVDFPLPLIAADLSAGFYSPTHRIGLVSDHEIFHRYHRRIRKKKFREGVAIADYRALQKGDFVVHSDFGIARYLGLKTLLVDKRHRDCLELQYAGSDKLFVPIEEFNRVGKYSGSERIPDLTRLGGPGWEKLKERTARAVADMADDLLRLYARRITATGYAFGEDTVFVRQLEASFPYDETADQERAIADVKADMQSTRPMDRLVCGDVGFGKTEVAIRAAFKAIDAGKQVAVLVPTTVLAQQHFATFRDRLADYPVRVELLSRFRTRKEQLAVTEGLKQGTVDLVIGTHKLLGADISFRDLGLLVIDEEHRFGVKHKETIRQLRAHVDTLAMTATPIPRTLQMSLMGVRDMSLIATSPKDRLPIITQVAEFEKSLILTAIRRELDRGGQVFFVHNRVQTIDSMQQYLESLLPGVRIGVAHGQMHERALEGVMLAFMAGSFQVLLCTSIIESGLDIPSANTIIINRADRFGLAQLYQLRGRVGRSSRRAYAYLLTPPIKLLNVDAMKRMRALEAHTNLGSGFALAMRDLEIRGAGTLLGSKQSGFIEEIGFELYSRLLEEAIARLKGEEIVGMPDTKLELDLETYLPEAYLPDAQQKVDIYRRLADARTQADVDLLADEVADRFGSLPPVGKDLFNAAGIKIEAARLGVEKLRLRSGRVSMQFKDGKSITRPQLEALRTGTDVPMEFSFVPRTVITIDLAPLAESNRLPLLRKLLVEAG